MSVNADPRRPASARIIVLGSPEDGAGKSTIAMHAAIALLNCGQRVATVDLDARHACLTRYVESRRDGAVRRANKLALPTHVSIASNNRLMLDQDKAIDFPGLAEVVAHIGPAHDFIVVDTSATDGDLTRLVHSLADTLITPIDDSRGVFGAFDPTDSAVVAERAYAEAVRFAREHRRAMEGTPIDWVVVCNRLATPQSRGATDAGLNRLAAELGFRCIDGLAERALYRDLFERGLTALDRLDHAALGVQPSLAHVTAQREAMSLITGLKFPVEERGPPRAGADAQWLSAPPIVPLGEHDLLET